MLPVFFPKNFDPTKKYKLIPIQIPQTTDSTNSTPDLRTDEPENDTSRINKMSTEPSDRINILSNWNNNPNQGVIEYQLRESLSDTFSELIDKILNEGSKE